jgi:hypothetical protein
MSQESSSLRLAQDPGSAPVSRVPSPTPLAPNSFSATSASISTPAAAGTSLTVPTSIATSSLYITADGSQALSSPDALSELDNTAGEVDPQILEALRSKDRLYVLKLGELMEGLLNDRR